MRLYEILLCAIGLSMDAFAVAVCKGLAIKKINFSKAVIVGAWFGIFQGIMPLIGYFIGSSFAGYITKYTHWVAFGLLLLIGANMIREAVSKEEEDADASLAFFKMLLLALATSIDALAVGVTLSMTPPTIGVWGSAAIICAVTFVLSMVGVKIGNVFGAKYEKKAELAGGCILILLGIKILVDAFIG